MHHSAAVISNIRSTGNKAFTAALMNADIDALITIPLRTYLTANFASVDIGISLFIELKILPRKGIVKIDGGSAANVSSVHLLLEKTFYKICTSIENLHVAFHYALSEAILFYADDMQINFENEKRIDKDKPFNVVVDASSSSKLTKNHKFLDTDKLDGPTRRSCARQDSNSPRLQLSRNVEIVLYRYIDYAIRKVQDNREALELNGLHQLFVYADDVNMLGENPQTIGENTGILLEANAYAVLVEEMSSVFRRNSHYSLSQCSRSPKKKILAYNAESRHSTPNCNLCTVKRTLV
ncbi:hypothetical protein ANN_21142 [Periplaneta americana]|uniref:Uncharacterized protein n=1 Tax=Periplaneta americana TaxID=6978 RepID=A0ABQ8SEM6_PERAM|nr:hypothetical protein ANN_21142 [Periplaneta americana]